MGCVSLSLAESSAQEREVVRKTKQMEEEDGIHQWQDVGMDPCRPGGGDGAQMQPGTGHALKKYQQCRSWEGKPVAFGLLQVSELRPGKKESQSNVFL